MKKLILLLAVFTIALSLQSIAQVTTSQAQKGAYTGTLPLATVAGISSGDITIVKLSATDTLGTTNSNFIISSFSFSAKVNGAPANIASTSNQINADMKAVIKKLLVGNQILFNNIKAKYKPNGTVYDLTGITLTIK